MNAYLWIKVLHILSATVLFGTGIGIAFFKWIADRSGDVRAIRIVNERVVLADVVFTTPAVIVQPMSGLWLALHAGYSLTSGWLLWTMLLYVLAGACWLLVVWLQLSMRNMAQQADDAGLPLAAR